MNIPMILNLTIKDFKVYRKHIAGWALYGLALSMLTLITLSNEGKGIAGPMVTIYMLLGMASTVLFLPEKRKGGWILTASLPITRRAMFTARFLSSYVIFLVNLMLWVLTFSLLQIFGVIASQSIFTTKTITMAFIIVLLHWSIFYASYFRFNFVITIILYMSSLFGPLLLIIIYWHTKGTFVPFFVEGDLTMILIPFIIVLILFSISFFTSMENFVKKDI